MHKLFGILQHGTSIYAPLYLCIYLSISQCSPGFLNSIWVRSQYFISFFLQLFQFWPLGVPSVGSQVPLVYSHYMGFAFLTTPCFQAHLAHFHVACIPASSFLFAHPKTSQFSKEHCFLLLGEGIRNQYLCTRCPRCCLDEVAATPSQLTKQRNVCVHISSHICTFLCKCLNIGINLDSDLNMNTC